MGAIVINSNSSKSWPWVFYGGSDVRDQYSTSIMTNRYQLTTPSQLAVARYCVQPSQSIMLQRARATPTPRLTTLIPDECYCAAVAPLDWQWGR